jgi:hypothetical protein
MAYEILDPERIQPARATRKIEWPVSLKTRMRFRDLLYELVDLEMEPQTPEVLERMASLREDISSLPGYPRNAHPERDLIVPVTTTEHH